MNAPPDGPLILLDPHPRRIETIFAPEDRRRLDRRVTLAWIAVLAIALGTAAVLVAVAWRIVR